MQSSLASVDTSLQSETGEISTEFDTKSKKGIEKVVGEDSVKNAESPGKTTM